MNQNALFEQALEFWKTCPEGLDLTNENHLDQVRTLADSILAGNPSARSLREWETEFCKDKDALPLMAHLAVKLALSKTILREIKGPVHVSVVFAAYKEHNRIRRKAEHEHGEDFLNRKISQLNWLCGDFPNKTWDLRMVDDGCPENSGAIAEEILAKAEEQVDADVLYLQNAIDKKLPITLTMQSASKSQKGGSIQYGMWEAAQRIRSENHLIVFTDADLSTHLGQIGLLADGIINHGKLAAIGSRREPASIVVKKGIRNIRGKLFIYLWKRIITNLNYIVDTQCGFKAFRAETIGRILDDPIERKFAFDVELLLKTELLEPNSIAKTAVAWIDSETASTTTGIGPYLSMLKALVRMYRRYLPANPSADEFAKFIESLSEDQWQSIVTNIPTEIADRAPSEFAQYSGVGVDRLKEALQD